MQNLSDNELDKHFQEASEKYRPPFDPEGWQRMQERLAESDRSGGFAWKDFRRGLPFLLIFLAGSVTGVLTWSYLSKSKADFSGASGSEQRGTGTNLHAFEADIPDEPKPPSSDDGRDTARLDKQSPEVPESREGITFTKAADNIADPNPSLNSVVPEEFIGNREHQRHTANGTALTQLAPRVDKENQDRKSDDGNPAAEKSEPRPSIPSAAGPDNVSDLSAFADSAALAQPGAIQPKQPVSRKRQRDARTERRPTYRLSVIAAMSPDFSSVNFGKQTKPGSNYAGIIEVHATPNWSIASGIISSTKRYEARDIEYSGYAIPEAEGDCRIIDIPVNVYYRSSNSARLTWFAGAGISSYLMKKENYVFYYDSPNGQTSYAREVRNENNEWFRILNVSAGLSRSINSQLSIELEPFVKIPLAGIGEGELNVNTVGMFLRARYSLIKSH